MVLGATDQLWQLEVLEDKTGRPVAREFTGAMKDGSEESAQILSHFIL